MSISIILLPVIPEADVNGEGGSIGCTFLSDTEVFTWFTNLHYLQHRRQRLYIIYINIYIII